MNIGTILVPVDFSVCSTLVTRHAAGLGARRGVAGCTGPRPNRWHADC